MLARRLRPVEAEEVRATDGSTPVEALVHSFARSDVCRTLFMNDEVAAMYGVQALVGTKLGAVWLLTSDLVERYPIAFWRLCRPEIDRLLERWDVLTNAIDARHEKALRWARRLGFRVEEAKPFGVEGRLFHQFTVRKEDLHG